MDKYKTLLLQLKWDVLFIIMEVGTPLIYMRTMHFGDYLQV